MATTAKDADETTIERFREGLRGTVIRPDDPEFDDARTIYNAMIDKRPGLIVRCANVGDVIAAVKFAREQDFEAAIRSGGHSGPGLGLVDDGLVIDLSGMTGIHVDPDAKTVRVEPGCTWGDVDSATHAFGLATVSGVISTTGVSGLTLGGGHGYLTRKYGLTIDNLLSADVVLADGRLVRASEDEHEDLFWALRGGGGNFGVVVSFEYELHPVDTVVGGPLFWPISELETTMRWYREWLPQAPEDVYAFYLIAEVPGEPFPEELHGKNVCGLMWCCLGSEAETDAALQSARDAAEPLFEHVESMPYPAIQGMFDGLYPPGDQWYWKGDYVRELTDDAIAVHERFSEVPTPKSTMHLYPIDGAVHDVAPDETAWSVRDATWSMVIVGVDADPANDKKITKWARDYWHALHPHTVGGSYINFMMEEGEDRVQASYGDNYERLRAVKATYDPDNFFHVNQNIEPAN
ncbi:FAD linked oxidase domain protein [Haladaptatus paucihalophilus DX253]|uniref:FAD linked oxidase domain protein n=1 Tax=Haladaptatus paucihalophilus DX253 TaxID=797209 RepID=E7QTU5_HALPU|nr:FAD-binding oxidoreductase [Haladaptatus paucihalophilus]EFW92024.1 FAD linked oxidase domain protein [Haladaptatus paucihalophilus DX253]SHK86050.1 FAD/FMN-containing dehydrogenase [Haladaptatus paucihalophilus DX253]